MEHPLPMNEHGLVGLRHADGVQFIVACACGDYGEPTKEHDGSWTLTDGANSAVHVSPSINFKEHFHTTNPVDTHWLNEGASRNG